MFGGGGGVGILPEDVENRCISGGNDKSHGAC
jgi:hypothetical protein